LESRPDVVENFAVRKENCGRKIDGKCGERRGRIAPAQTNGKGIDDRNKRQSCPDREGANRTDLMFRWQESNCNASRNKVRPAGFIERLRNNAEWRATQG
jgi:hypothetical protein